MRHAVSTLRSQLNKPDHGFSLIELLVTLLIASMMMTIMAGFTRMSVGTKFDTGLRSETVQGLRALQSMVSQEVRQAGACLPTAGPFIALAGVDNGTLDELTVRIGRTSSTTGRCINPNLTTDASTGATAVTLASTSDFAVGGLVYITNQINGNLNQITAKSATTLTLTSGLNTAYAANATSVYAIDQRTYKVMTGPLGNPTLHVAVDGGAFVPLVDGVGKFRVQYWTGPCLPNCTITDFPASAAAWYTVAEISLDVTVSGHKNNRAGQAVTENGQVTIKPRNLYLQ